MEWLLSAFISLTFICLSNPFYLAHPSCIHAPSRKNPTAMGFERQVIVVGGGIGGLAVASRMSSSTDRWKVTILEKNSNIGGRCGSFVREVAGVGTFRHERGPSLLLLPDVYQDIFRDCASQDAKDFGLMTKQCVPAYQVVFEDGDSIEVGFPRQPTECIGDSEITSREKMNSYEHDGAKKWDEYMRATGAFLDAGLSNFIEERLDLASFPKFLQESLRDFAKVCEMGSLYTSNVFIPHFPINVLLSRGH